MKHGITLAFFFATAAGCGRPSRRALCPTPPSPRIWRSADPHCRPGGFGPMIRRRRRRAGRAYELAGGYYKSWHCEAAQYPRRMARCTAITASVPTTLAGHRRLRRVPGRLGEREGSFMAVEAPSPVMPCRCASRRSNRRFCGTGMKTGLAAWCRRLQLVATRSLAAAGRTSAATSYCPRPVTAARPS